MCVIFSFSAGAATPHNRTISPGRFRETLYRHGWRRAHKPRQPLRTSDGPSWKYIVQSPVFPALRQLMSNTDRVKFALARPQSAQAGIVLMKIMSGERHAYVDRVAGKQKPVFFVQQTNGTGRMPRRVDDLQRPSAEIEHITVSQRQILGLRKLLPGHQRIDFPLVVRVAHRRPRFHKPFAHRIVQRETAAVFPIQRVEIHMQEMARAAHMVRVSVCRNNNEGKPCKPFDVFRAAGRYLRPCRSTRPGVFRPRETY